MSNLIILKTHPDNFCQVVKLQQHALKVKMRRVQRGDLLLLAKMQRDGPALVYYAMRFKEQRPAKAGETEENWDKTWTYIVEGESCCELDRPFDPQKERVTPTTRKNYGPGGTFVYVDPEDAAAFRKRGFLRPF